MLSDQAIYYICTCTFGCTAAICLSCAIWSYNKYTN
jgi:hypothetical protein